MEDSQSSPVTLDFLLYEIQSLKTSILTSKADLTKVISETRDEIIEMLYAENSSLKKSVKNLKKELEEKDELITDIERDVTGLQQYVRRNNIEIAGIPNTISHDNLEKKVIEIGEVLDIKIKSFDIEACHRLPSYKSRRNHTEPLRTIVRFCNRKIAEQFHRKKKNLKNNNRLNDIGLGQRRIYVNNNLCPYYRMLWGKCKSLYNEQKITSFWAYNGIINIIETEVFQNNTS